MGGIGPPLSLSLSLLQPLELPFQVTLLLSGLFRLRVAQLPFQGVNLPLQLFPPAVCSCQLLPSRSYGLLQLPQPLLLLGNLSVQLSLARQGSLHLAQLSPHLVQCLLGFPLGLLDGLGHLVQGLVCPLLWQHMGHLTAQTLLPLLQSCTGLSRLHTPGAGGLLGRLPGLLGPVQLLLRGCPRGELGRGGVGQGPTHGTGLALCQVLGQNPSLLVQKGLIFPGVVLLSRLGLLPGHTIAFLGTLQVRTGLTAPL